MTEGLNRECVRITTPRGALAGELAYADGEPAAACLLINPHPHMGGQMGNSLIARLAEELPSTGALTLRFDYAGVGESEGGEIDLYTSMAQFWQTGTAPEDPFMLEDARHAFDWLHGQVDVPLFLVGYSFGTSAVAAMLDVRTAGIVLISPTIGRHDFSALERSAVPKLVVYSDDDFATPASVTEHWLASLPGVWATACIHGGNHFFRGQETQVAQLCADFVMERLRGWA